MVALFEATLVFSFAAGLSGEPGVLRRPETSWMQASWGWQDAVLPQIASPVASSGDELAPASQDYEPCEEGMRIVTGLHHENVTRLCLKFSQDTCWSYFPELSTYESRQTPIAVCMDRFEWPNREGKKPSVMLRFIEARAACEAVGKRLCSEFEWETACEGPKVLPFPYGYAFEPEACINEKPYRAYDQSKLSSRDKKVRNDETWRLYQAERAGSRERCTSAHGISDLVGNVEEWVTTSRPEWPYESSLKGGFWAKPRSACRGTNDSHGPNFRFYEIGFRCCKDPVPKAPKPATQVSTSGAVQLLPLRTGA